MIKFLKYIADILEHIQWVLSAWNYGGYEQIDHKLRSGEIDYDDIEVDELNNIFIKKPA